MSDGKRAGAFAYYGHDGVAYRGMADITVLVDGTVGLNDVPSCIVFTTREQGYGAGNERVRIRNNGNVGFNTATPLGLGHFRGRSTLNSYYVLYADNYTAPANPFFSVTGAGNTGINTGAPARNLHVEGTGRITGSVGSGGFLMMRDATGDITNAATLNGITVSGTTISAIDQSATNEIQRLDTLSVVSGSLRVSLLNDGVPFSSVALPIADGSETKVNAGAGTAVTGAGTTASPYVVTNTGDTNAADDITTGSTASGDISGTFGNLQIVANAVTGTEIANNAITLSKMAPASVNSNVIVNGSISALDFADQGATTGQVLAYGGAGFGYTPASSGGDVSGPYTGLQIVANAVTEAEIADNSVGSSEIVNGSILATDLFFATYSLGSTIYSDGTQWVFGQSRQVGYTDNNLGGGTGSITLSSNRVDNLVRGSNWTSLTVSMPNGATDGQESTVTFNVSATSVTWSGNGNTLVGTLPSAIAIGDTFKFKYYNQTSSWYRITY